MILGTFPSDKSLVSRAYYQNKLDNAQYSNTVDSQTGKVTKYDTNFNKEVLGLEYETITDEDGNTKEIIKNPFGGSGATSEPVGSLDCGGQAPDQYGCCPGEVYTDMGDQGFNCCPSTGGDCFPPFDLN